MQFWRAASCIQFRYRRYGDDKIAGGLLAQFWSCNLERDKNCIELRDKTTCVNRALGPVEKNKNWTLDRTMDYFLLKC